MKKLLFIGLILAGCNVSAQFNSKTYFKHNEVDGWVKCVETNWFTVSQKGDTTYWYQLTEDTDQDDPNVKPKYEFNGAGVLIKHDTVAKKQVVNKPLVFPMYINDRGSDTVMFTTNGKDHFIKEKGKWTKSTKYKTRYKYRNRKSKPVIKYIANKPKQIETIKFIDYKKRLWMVVSKRGGVTMLDSSNEKTALAKFKKINGSPVLSITEFSQDDIIR